MALDSWIWILIPISWAIATGVGISAFFRYRTATAQAHSSAAAGYQTLAADAVRSQQELTRTLSGMTESLKEIERVLTEV